MRAYVAAILILAGCKQTKKESPPAPAPTPPVAVADAAVAAVAPLPDAAPPADEKRPLEVMDVPREHGVPTRTPCKADCDMTHPMIGEHECGQAAAGILMVGTMEQLVCKPREVTIDCCAPIKADDIPAITKALGWEKATQKQRTAIAWLVSRVVLGEVVMEKPSPDEITTASFSKAVAKPMPEGALELDYWTASHDEGEPVWLERIIIFDASGATTAQHTEVEIGQKEDAARVRQEAIKAAREAGILGKDARSGSGSGSGSGK